MIEQPDDERVEALLKELGPADPPPGFADDVMTQIGQLQRVRTGRVSTLPMGGLAMKKLIWGIAAAAAIVLGIFAVRGFPPVEQGTEGTIAAAKKYQAAQLSDKDVVTGDAAAQAFLQSAEFDRLIKDPQARSLLSDPSIRVQLANADLVHALTNADIRAALSSNVVHQIFADASMRAELDAALRVQMSGAVRADGLRSDLVRQAMADPSLSAALSNASFRVAMSDAGFRVALMNPAMSSALNAAAFVQSLQNPGFAQALSTSQFAAALRQ